MLKILNLISNNYFLKQKLSVPTLNSPVRRLTDTWQGISKQGKEIIEKKLTAKKISNFNEFLFLRDLRSDGTLQARSIARSLVILIG